MNSLVIFAIGQVTFCSIGTDSIIEVKHYLTDFSWLDKGVAKDSPYPNDMMYGIGVIWGIVFIVNFFYSWSYILFPSKKE